MDDTAPTADTRGGWPPEAWASLAPLLLLLPVALADGGLDRVAAGAFYASCAAAVVATHVARTAVWADSTRRTAAFATLGLAASVWHLRAIAHLESAIPIAGVGGLLLCTGLLLAIGRSAVTAGRGTAPPGA